MRPVGSAAASPGVCARDAAVHAHGDPLRGDGGTPTRVVPNGSHIRLSAGGRTRPHGGCHWATTRVASRRGSRERAQTAGARLCLPDPVELTRALDGTAAARAGTVTPPGCPAVTARQTERCVFYLRETMREKS